MACLIELYNRNQGYVTKIYINELCKMHGVPPAYPELIKKAEIMYNTRYKNKNLFGGNPWT